jgi:Tol biopolymer transport system component
MWDAYPAFSPDSRALAFFSCETMGAGLGVCDLHVLALDSELRPKGAPRRLSSQRIGGAGVAWTRDGRSIVYGGATVDVSHLWRVPADGSSPPERVELAGPRAKSPFTVTSRDRLGFIRSFWNVNIHRVQVGATVATPLIASTAWDFQPQYSPDGQRIAFDSEREGDTHEVWLANADGSTPTRLTHGPGRMQGSARWSPDGRTISFDAQAEDGHFDVWTIGVDGSGLRQITHRAADVGPSSWSRDGRWLYFNSTRTGRYQVWRVPAAGGSEEQVTREGGYLPFESPDGSTLYYKKAMGDSPLLARPTTGGEERLILTCIPAPFGYAVGPKGVFHLDCSPPGTKDSLQRTLRHWDARTGQDRLITTLDTGPYAPLGLSVSADGQSVLFTHSTTAIDLMMIENFR